MLAGRGGIFEILPVVTQAVQFVWNRLGLILWLSLIAVVVILTLIDPDKRSVVPVYRFGVEQFLSHMPLYDLNSQAGFLYAPAFAPLFAPFWLLGDHLGDVLWRLAGVGVLTMAAVEQVRRTKDADRIWILSCALFVALPLSAGAVRNGQATILLAGASWLAILAAVEGRRWPLFLWAAVALVSKPLAIVPLLLIGGVFPAHIPVLAGATALVLAIPFLFAPPDYVTELYRLFAELILSASVETKTAFVSADFAAVFRAAGMELSDQSAMAIRLLFSLLTLGAALVILRWRRHEAALCLAVLATFYMTVFNPRVESNTYALLAIPFGIVIARMIRSSRTRIAGVGFATIVFAAGLTGVDRMVHKFTEFWFKPLLLSLVLAAIVATEFFGRPRSKSE